MMTILKKIASFVVQPFRLVSHKNISEKISLFFAKHKAWVYIITFLFTALIIYFVYRP
jgi:hypothetical protein